MKTLYKHYCGPTNPILHLPGTEVLNPFVGTDRITQDEAISILVCRDPRKASRIKNAHEGYSFNHQK